MLFTFNKGIRGMVSIAHKARGIQTLYNQQSNYDLWLPAQAMGLLYAPLDVEKAKVLQFSAFNSELWEQGELYCEITRHVQSS